MKVESYIGVLSLDFFHDCILELRLQTCSDTPQSCLVSSSRDYTIRLWDPRAGGEALSSLEGHMNEVTSVAWHRNGHHILSAGRDNQLKVRPSPA